MYEQATCGTRLSQSSTGTSYTRWAAGELGVNGAEALKQSRMSPFLPPHFAGSGRLLVGRCCLSVNNKSMCMSIHNSRLEAF